MRDLLIDRLEENGVVVVTNNGDDVPLGACFNNLRTVTATEPEGSSEDVPGAEIDVVVKEIIFFRKTVDVLPRGCSGAIRLKGAGLSLVEEAARRKAKGEYVHLQAAT